MCKIVEVHNFLDPHSSLFYEEYLEFGNLRGYEAYNTHETLLKYT